MVAAKQGRKAAKRELPLRFSEAIDMAAMRSGAHGTDAYLQDWRQGAAVACDDDLEKAAQTEFERLQREYDDDRLKDLVNAHGRDGT